MATELENTSYLKPLPLEPGAQSIRILHLHKDAQLPDFPLHATQQVTSLANKPEETVEYYALSWYWGAPIRTKTIIVDGHEVKISRNVWSALTALVERFGTVKVWVDMLCVDQENEREKSHQVEMMGDVYRCAARVYAWTGPADADSDYLFEFIARGKDDEGFVDDEKLYDCLGKFMERPCWSRVWTLQERSLNDKLSIMAGECICDWAVFEKKAVAWLRGWITGSKESAHKSGMPSVEALTALERKMTHTRVKQEMTVLDVLQGLSTLECAIDVDLIYGLRGIVL